MEASAVGLLNCPGAGQVQQANIASRPSNDAMDVARTTVQSPPASDSMADVSRIAIAPPSSTEPGRLANLYM